MEKLNWGIIGCGDVTEKKSGPAFYTLPQTTLQAVMRRDATKAADYAVRHQVPTWYTDASRLIQDPQVQAIYIATPPDTHAFYAIKALEAGKPVYVEKPMALNLAECRKMIEVSEKTGTPLFVAYYRRKMSYFQKVKEIVESGVLGNIIMANIRLWRNPLPEDRKADKPWRLNPDYAGGGYFVDMGTHQIDLLLWLFGPLRSVKGAASNRGGLYAVEDTVDAVFEFQSGILAVGSWCFVVPEKSATDTFEIIGTKGRLSFSTFQMECIRKVVNGVEEFIAAHKPEVVEKQMISYVSDLILEGKQDRQALSDAVEVTRIVDDILAEYRRKDGKAKSE